MPFKYLGAPIYKGRCRNQFFGDLVETFATKIEGWHTRFLSFGGKITLLKAILSSLPIQLFSCMVIPGKFENIEKLMSSFLWSQKGQHRTHWVSWRKVCRPESEGGLRVGSIADTIFGLHGKLAWKLCLKILYGQECYCKNMGLRVCMQGMLYGRTRLNYGALCIRTSKY